MPIEWLSWADGSDWGVCPPSRLTAAPMSELTPMDWSQVLLLRVILTLQKYDYEW
jgi:hypothetical protein